MTFSKESIVEIINRNNVAPFITKDDSEIREILAPGNSSLKNQSLAEARVSPGKSTKQHYHVETEEIYYILQGRARVEVGSKLREVGEGDGIAILPGQRHKICNTGTEELVFLCCCSPCYKDKDTEFSE